MRYFLEISYCGDNYAGWQRQKNALTIQEVMEEKIGTVIKEKIDLVGCGRTDAGVHATQFYTHLDTERAEFSQLTHRFNSILPPDISILNIQEVNEEAHARFDATAREYIYRISLRKNPFLRNRAFEIHQPDKIDKTLLQNAAQMLLGFNDFYSFCKTRSDVKTTICELTKCTWEFEDSEMTFHIRANRFLRGMVRLIVGMCLNIAWGKSKLDTVIQQIANKQRLDNPWSVPAYGLYLSKIEYPFLD